MSDSYISPTVANLKRAFDVFAAISGLIILAPILPLIALIIRLDSPGPVIFTQNRIGRGHKDRVDLFTMYKFRSMVQDAEAASGAVWAKKRDPRITRVGRILRKTRLDEIPQLINVLKGDMSLIGPRPERPGIYPKLENNIPFFAERTYGVRPGITGLAQVYQGYDETLDDVRNKVAYDHAYALSLSSFKSWLRMELEILRQTVVVVVAGRGQ